MSIEKEMDGKEILIVVLDGTKLSKKSNNSDGVAPLRCALRQLVKPGDEVVVLVIFDAQVGMPSPDINAGLCCGRDGRSYYEQGERNNYIRILREEISQGTETYMEIFMPFYYRCKSSGVKFLVKIVVGSQPGDIVMDEANNNTEATWLILERSFTIRNASWLNQRNFKLSFISDDEEVALYAFGPSSESVKSSSFRKTITNLKTTRLKRKQLYERRPIYCTLPNFEGIYQVSSTITSTSNESESSSSEKIDDRAKNNVTSIEEFLGGSRELGMPVELSWEVISEITNQFRDMICNDPNGVFQLYMGCLKDRVSHVLVKRYVRGDFTTILEAEKRAAVSMYHKNIIGLLGYHQNENAMALVFPYASRGTLTDRVVNGGWASEMRLRFVDKMHIAIEIGQAIRYMHEECPGGPIVHGDLRPCNILLGDNLKPMILGFGKTKWLRLQQSPFSPNERSCTRNHPSDPESLALIKSDIFAFGVFLLRLFCKRSSLRDEKSLVKWARPLLGQRAYHKLYDEAMEYDMHGIFVVTCVVAKCIRPKPSSRPCIAEVVSFLKGEISYAEQSSPATDCSSSPTMVD